MWNSTMCWAYKWYNKKWHTRFMLCSCQHAVLHAEALGKGPHTFCRHTWRPSITYVCYASNAIKASKLNDKVDSYYLMFFSSQKPIDFKQEMKANPLVSASLWCRLTSRMGIGTFPSALSWPLTELERVLWPSSKHLTWSEEIWKSFSKHRYCMPDSM